MKHLALLLAAVGIMVLLTACGSVDQCKKLEEADYSYITQDYETYAIRVNESQKNKKKDDKEEPKYITMTLPSNYVDQDRSQKEWDKLCKEMGYKSITLDDDDGSVSYVMTEEQYEDWMDMARAYTNSTIDACWGILSFSPYMIYSANDDFTKISLISNEREFDKDSGYSVYDIIQAAKVYNTYAQKDIDNVDIKLSYLDDEVYEQYLDDCDQYEDDMRQYERDLKEYKSKKKSGAKAPVEPTEPVEPKPESLCTVSSSDLFD